MAGNIPALQILRFMASFLVILGHAIPAATEMSNVYPAMLQTRLLGGIGVDVFFLISGFIMIVAHYDDFGTAGAAGRFIVKRLIRIMPIYLVFNLISLLIVAVGSGGGLSCNKIDITYIVSSALFIPRARCDGVMLPLVSQGWTLNLEFLFYVCFMGGLPFKRKAGICIILCLLALPYVIDRNLPHPADGAIDDIIRFYGKPIVALFATGSLFGIIYKKCNMNLQIFGRGIIIAFVVLLLCLTAEGFSTNIFGIYPPYFVSGSSCLIFLACLFSKVDPRNGTDRTVVLLGNASYSTYLCHVLALTAVRKIWNRCGLWTHPILYIGAGCLIALCAGLLTHIFVERRLTSLVRRSVFATIKNSGPASLRDNQPKT